MTRGFQGIASRAPKRLPLVVLPLLVLLLGSSCGVDGQDLPTVVDERFDLSLVYSTMYVEGGPTQTLLSPCSDHVILIGKGGVVKLYPAADEQFTFEAQAGEGRDSYETLADLQDDTNSWGDHGLLSAQLHMEFPAKPYLFLFYSIAPDAWPGQCTDMTDGMYFCEQNAVLERLELGVSISDDGTCSDLLFEDVPAARVRLMEDWCSSANAHHNAALEFFPDGSLLVGNGDSSQPTFDPGYADLDKCYNPDEPRPQGYFKAQNDAFLQGHIIRISKEAIMYEAADLPLIAADYEIWAKGLRNPFRLDVDADTWDIYIADVGDASVEEINILRNPLEADASSLPANFGWPCLEGDGIPLSTYNWIAQSCDPDSEDCGICDDLFACTEEYAGGESSGAECDPAYVAPGFQYDHGVKLTEYDGQGGLCGEIGNSISAVGFFEGRLYAADYSKKCLWFFEADGNGAPDLDKPVIIAEGAGAEIVDLVDGGDGYLYGTNFALSKLVRIEPVGLEILEGSGYRSDNSSSTTSIGDKPSTPAPSSGSISMSSGDDGSSGATSSSSLISQGNNNTRATAHEDITPVPTTLVPSLPAPNALLQDTPAPTAPLRDTPAPTALLLDTQTPHALLRDTPAPSALRDKPAPSALLQDTPFPSPPLQDTPAPSALLKDTPAPSALLLDTQAPHALLQDTPAPNALLQDTPAPSALQDTPAPSALLQDTPFPSPPLQDTPAPSALLQDTPAPSALLQNTPVPSALLEDTLTPSAFLGYTSVPTTLLQHTTAPSVLHRDTPAPALIQVTPAPALIQDTPAPTTSLQDPSALTTSLQGTPAPALIQVTSAPTTFLQDTPTPTTLLQDTPAPALIQVTLAPTSQESETPVALLGAIVDSEEGYCPIPCEVDVGATVVFMLLLSGSYGNNINITEYSISFGDGKSYSGSDVDGLEHTYESDGVFVVEATVTDSEDLSLSDTLVVVVGEPFTLVMFPDSGEWVVGDTITFNLTRVAASTVPDDITWSSTIEHCVTDTCTGDIGCHLHSLSQVDTAPDGMSGSVVPIAHALPSQVILTVQLIFDLTTVLDYQWPTSSKTHSVMVTSLPGGFTIYYDDKTCQYTPCMASFMSNSSASFAADTVQSVDMKVYEFSRWTVSHAGNTTDSVQAAALNNLMIDSDGIQVTAEYEELTPTLASNVTAPVVVALGGYYTKIVVEWNGSADGNSFDHVIAYATTADELDGDTFYQSSKAIQASLSTSAELLVSEGKSNYTVYLRGYNSADNTISARSTAYEVASADDFDPSNICPEDIPRVQTAVETEEPSDGLLAANASRVPGIVQAEDFDAWGEGMAFHDSSPLDYGQSGYREDGEGVDLQRSANGSVHVAWTLPGEWLSYTVQCPGSDLEVLDVSVRYALLGSSNGIALGRDLEDASDCSELADGDEQAIMVDANLPETGGYEAWAWTENASVSLEPGPHVITMCFIGDGVVNVDLLRFTSSSCGNGVCEGGIEGETCSTCPQDCGECSTPFTSLVIPGVIQAEDFDVGGQGISFGEDLCIESSNDTDCEGKLELISDYRNESYPEGQVGLRDVDGGVVWGWTSKGEWLLYTVEVSDTRTYNVTLRYSSPFLCEVDLLVDTYSCNAQKDADLLLGTVLMPDTGGQIGPFKRTQPLTTLLEAGAHTLRVCVVQGGFALDEIAFEILMSGVCNDDGRCDIVDGEDCDSCGDCTCSEGNAFEGSPFVIPGFVEAYRFDEGANGVAYLDDTLEGLGGSWYRPDAAVDVEADVDGSLHVGYGTPGEWLKYTVYASKGGVYGVRARYATLADSTALAVTVDDGTDAACTEQSEGLVFFEANLPSFGSWNEWIDTEMVEVPLPAGMHVFKLCILRGVTGAADTNLKGLNMSETWNV